MYEPIKKEQKLNALILKAVSNPVRIYLLEEIRNKKICVCELAKKLNMSFGAISKHFSVLKNAGLVYEERDGNNIYCRLTCECIFDLVETSKKVFDCINKKRRL